MNNEYTLDNFEVKKTILCEENEFITSMIKLHDKRIAVCSNAKTIKIFDPINNYNLDFSFSVEVNTKSKKDWMIQLQNGHIVVSSNNSDKLEIYSLSQNKSKKEFTIIDKDAFSFLVPLSNNRFASISNGKCKVWKGDLPYNEAPITELKQGDLTDIRLFQIKDTEILAILVSESIQLWDLNEYKFLKSIKIHSDYSLFIVQIDDETILSGSSVVNIKTGQYYSFVNASFYSFKSAIKLRDDRILIFGKEHDIDHEGDVREFKLFNTKTKEFTYKEIKESIKYPIVIDEHTFITAKKNYIKVWKY